MGLTTNELRLLDKIKRVEKEFEEYMIETKKQLLEQAELNKNLHESVLALVKYIKEQKEKTDESKDTESNA